MSDDSLEGRQGEPFTMRVELGKVREFARATKSKNPEYLESDEPVMPVTFLQTSAFWQTPASSPTRGMTRDMSRVLHGGQEFVFHGEPPRAGAVLTGQTRVDKVYTKQGSRGGAMNFTEMVTEYRDETGKVVAESRTISIVTERAPSGG